MSKTLTILALLLFTFTLFGNLQYPLLWNDESECAMHSKRVLEYGTPKKDDGKNRVYPLRLAKKDFATDSYGNYIGIGWGMFYVGAGAEFFAQLSEDIYVKTALLRLPFALLAFVGVLIFWITFMKLISEFAQKTIFTVALFLLLPFHVDIALHLREMRYYALVVFFSSIFVYLFFHKRETLLYTFALPVVAFLVYFSFPPAAVVLLVSLGIFELYNFSNTKKWSNFTPLILSILAVLPLFIYFKTIEFNALSSAFYDFNFKVYLVHLRELAKYFFVYGYGFAYMLISLVLVYFKLKKQTIFLPKELLYLVVFSLVYMLIIAKIPHFVFTRYLVLVLVVECLVLAWLISILWVKLNVKYRLFLIFDIALIVVLVQGNLFLERMYELTHQYKGPLDYEIPFIKANYPNTQNLVIATNYEECAYMYYLGSKVTMGFVLNNLEKDLTEKPDIIIFRHDWAWNYEKDVFAPLFEKGNYKKHEFEIYDYPYNNISELNIPDGKHLFRTKFAKQDEEKANLFLLEK